MVLQLASLNEVKWKLLIPHRSIILRYLTDQPPQLVSHEHMLSHHSHTLIYSRWWCLIHRAVDNFFLILIMYYTRYLTRVVTDTIRSSKFQLTLVLISRTIELCLQNFVFWLIPCTMNENIYFIPLCKCTFGLSTSSFCP